MKGKKLCVALAGVFSVAACFGAFGLLRNVQKRVLSGNADAYLFENGYSDSLIAGMSGLTKRLLYEENAVFERASTMREGEEVVPGVFLQSELPGFSHVLIVSDCTTEKNYPKKILTYCWNWTGDQAADDESVELVWSGGFIALPETALFEIHGVGQIDINRSHSVPGYDPPYVEYENGTFLVERGNDAITSYSPGLGVGHRFAINDGLTFTRTYASGACNTYAIDPNNYRGCFSITLIKYSEREETNFAFATYTHGVKRTLESFSVAAKGTL